MDDAKQEMLLQVMVAFGHGTGGLRVSRETIAAMSTHYLAKYRPEMAKEWAESAAQALERIEVTARLAAQKAVQAGRTSIGPQDFSEAAKQVESTSLTVWCPPATS